MSDRSFRDVLRDTITNTTTDVRNGDFLWSDLEQGPLDTHMLFKLQRPNIAFEKSNKSFSGTDCTVAVIYNQEILILGNLETFSYSIFREKYPVRTLGRINNKGFTYGSRTIGGSLVFVQFDQNPLYGLFKFFNERTDKTHRFSSPLADDVPPFDMLLIFNNEYGASSVIRLYAVEIMQEGSVISINDIYSENTMQFIARDMDPMVSGSDEGSWKHLLYRKMVEGKLIDNYYASLLQQRARLESDIATLNRELTKLFNQSTGPTNLTRRRFRTEETDPNVVPEEGQGYSSRITERRQNRQRAREKQRKIEARIKILQNELTKLDASIQKYERTKMTWDMNSSLTKMNVDR